MAAGLLSKRVGGPLGPWPVLTKLPQLLQPAAALLRNQPACQTHFRQQGGLAALISFLRFLQQLPGSQVKVSFVLHVIRCH